MFTCLPLHANVLMQTCRCTGTTSEASSMALGHACEATRLYASCACSAVREGQVYPIKRWSAWRVLMVRKQPAAVLADAETWRL